MVNTLRPRWTLPHAVQREMDQVFDHFFGGANGGGVNGGGVNGNGETTAHAFAPASLWEEEGRWCIEFDLPGVKQEDIDVTLEKNTLKLTAERRETEGERKYWHQERSYGRVERLITLPETVDPEGIEAELKEGVLRLYLAKKPELQPKKIQVKKS